MVGGDVLLAMNSFAHDGAAVWQGHDANREEREQSARDTPNSNGIELSSRECAERQLQMNCSSFESPVSLEVHRRLPVPKTPVRPKLTLEQRDALPR